MSKFSDWTLAALDERFALTQVDALPPLEAWLANPPSLSDVEQVRLVSLKEELAHNVLHWNEQELSMRFIGPLFQLMGFNSKRFNLFAQRNLSGSVDGEPLSGRPDGMIASGWREPKVPYFCLQEYKPERDPEGDPVAQCLAAMLVARELNQGRWPVHGCYVLGRNWFLMVLQGPEYAMSSAYDGTQDDIFELFACFKSLKLMIENWTDNN